MDIAKWSIWKSNWWYICSQIWRSCMHSEKARPGVDCGSAHQLLVSKFRLKLKKAGKTTRTARYLWNPIPYEYIVKVTNSFKGLDLVNSVLEELWTEVSNIVQEAVNKTIPNKRKSKKAKWLSEEVLQIVVEWREVKSKGERESYIQLNAEFQRVARRDKRDFFNEQCLIIQANNKRGKTRDFFRKLETSRENSAQR